jgi:membrane protein DedA with SNARE-associated domain
MGMRYSRFILLDALGVLISVPLSIYLGKLFGGSMDTLRDRVHDMHLILAFVALSLVLTIVVRRRRIRPQAPVAAPEAGDDDPPPPPGL